MPTVRIRQVDGGLLEHECDEDLIRRYESLSKDLTGKALVHAVLGTTDLGTPPVVVELWRGEQLVARMPYR